MNTSYTDILFEHRNKRYGAYRLRKAYPKNVLIGFCVAVGLMLLVFFLPRIIAFFRPDSLFDMDMQVVQVDHLQPPPNFLTPAWYSPPPAPHPSNLVPKVTKDSVPEPKPKKDENPIVKSTDTTADKGNNGGNGTDTSANPEGQIYYIVDVLPKFPGEHGALSEFIQKNINYPEQERVMNHQGKVMVSAVVNLDGSLSDFKIVRGVTPALNAEAIRVLKLMPKWSPGYRNNKPVRVMVQIPVTFSLLR